MAGESSILYTYQVLYELTQRNEFIDYAIKHAGIVESCINNCGKTDLLYGNTGSVISYVNMFQLSDDNKYLDKAEVIMKGIPYLKEPYENRLTKWGVAHGVSGYILALVKLYKVTKKEDYLLAIEKMIEQYIDKKEILLKRSNSNYISWCNGIAGALMVENEIRNKTDIKSEKLVNDIYFNLKKCSEAWILKEQCLCHGNAGKYFIIREYEKQENTKYYKESIFDYGIKLSRIVIECNSKIKGEMSIPGFMLGIAGMGYFLLTLSLDLPNILSFDI